MKNGTPKQCSIFLKLHIWSFFWTGQHISKIICDQYSFLFLRDVCNTLMITNVVLKFNLNLMTRLRRFIAVSLQFSRYRYQRSLLFGLFQQMQFITSVE